MYLVIFAENFCGIINLNQTNIKLITENLFLINSTYGTIQSEMESLERFSSLINAELPADWPPGEYDRGAQEYFAQILQNALPEDAGWYNWYAIYRGKENLRGVVIGAAGYTGAPDENGSVEIGYSVSSDYRGKGFASEIVGALVANAFEDKRVKRIVANTSISNTASCRVLEKNGFHRICVNAEDSNIAFEIVRD